LNIPPYKKLLMVILAAILYRFYGAISTKMTFFCTDGQNGRAGGISPSGGPVSNVGADRKIPLQRPGGGVILKNIGPTGSRGCL
jgi:hypothetical protein